MPEIVASVRAALEPLIVAEVVSDVKMAGLAGIDGKFKPILSVSIRGERPEAHAAEISRLIHVAGLDVQWTIAADEQAS